jgi:cation diffusion facilitator family transporter
MTSRHHPFDPSPWAHAHRFGTETETVGERRTRWVVALTVTMMIGEITAGALFGSMALLADGWHMGTHAAALGVAAFAYWYARRHASDPRYTFGTGKVAVLGGFASAVGLAVVALLVIAESALRLASPRAIRYEQALAVAVLGLLVNLASALLLRGDRDHGHHHRDEEPEPFHSHHHDHNLRGAYLHVLADALTSVLAILALGAGRLLGWTWTDPVTGIAGGLVIARWSYGLLRDTSAVLLDGEISEERTARIRDLLEADGETRVADLHVWRVGPAHLAAIVSVVTASPRPPAHYRGLLARLSDLAHVTVEVHRHDEGRAR